MENTSGLKPLGRAVLVKPYEPERKESLIVIPESAQERLSAVDSRAVVVELGAAVWPDEPYRAKPGDKVLISKMAGFVAKGTRDGQLYRFINDRDIFAAITSEGDSNV